MTKTVVILESKHNDIVYFLPCKPGSIYVNVTDNCLNDCLFCIRRHGPVFFGNDLSLNGMSPNASEIVSSLEVISDWDLIKEVVICGMGEPLLRYDCVIETVRAIKELRKEIKIRIDTSGLFWGNNKRLDIVDRIDILSISLNAEHAQKYEELCQPKIQGAYDVLMDFLKNVKQSEEIHKERRLPFPEVRLSIVDTSEEDFIPASGREGYKKGTFPMADYEKCKRIADSFGWPLIVKRLFRDSKDDCWNDPSFKELFTRGISPDRCHNCSYRH